MTYNKKYYEKNREKIIETQTKWQSDKRKSLNKPKRLRALKAWKTRIKNGFEVKDKESKLKRLNKEIKELENERV